MCVAMSWKMLQASSDSRFFHPLVGSEREFGYSLSIRTKGSITDYRVIRIGIYIGTGSKIQMDSRPFHIQAHSISNFFHKFFLVFFQCPQCDGKWILGSFFYPHGKTIFSVDADDERGFCRFLVAVDQVD